MTTTRKIVFVMIDGLGDTAIPSLDHQTPLQRAATPVMDSIAATGLNGLMDPVEPGNACGSDTAHLSILGYPPSIYYRGRGAFESMGAGLHMVPGDIAFKSNFATLDPKTNIVTSRRADRHFEHLGPTLCQYLTDTIKLPSFPSHKVDFQYATEHRCGVRVRGPSLTDSISSTDPLKDNLPLLKAAPLNASSEAALTSKIVNELSDEVHKALEKHPINEKRRAEGKAAANVVLFRGCGCLIEAPQFQKRHGLEPFIIAPTCIIAGLAMSVGVDVVKAPGATGDYHTNLTSKARTAIDTLLNREKEYTFGFVHVKAVDDAGHDRNVDLKIKFLQDIDAMIGMIIKELSEAEAKSQGALEFSICVTGDHSTPVLSGDHSYEPVPFTVSKIRHVAKSCEDKSFRSPSGYADEVRQFSEQNVKLGVLGRFCGSEVISLLKNYSNV